MSVGKAIPVKWRVLRCGPHRKVLGGVSFMSSMDRITRSSSLEKGSLSICNFSRGDVEMVRQMEIIRSHCLNTSWSWLAVFNILSQVQCLIYNLVRNSDVPLTA